MLPFGRILSKKSGRIAIILIILSIVLTLFLPKEANTTKYSEVCFLLKDKKCINAEIADTPEKRERGLMYREGLKKDEGMLFVFPEENYYSFWMKNMKFPIDIIWIDGDYRIVHMERDAQPCLDLCRSYSPKEKAKYVLEVEVNFTARNSIGVNSTVNFLAKQKY